MILTKKQLEDMANCLAKHRCEGCTVKDTVGGACQIASAQTALTYREMLERLEWILENRIFVIGKGSVVQQYCPICGNSKEEGHAPECELAELLERSAHATDTASEAMERIKEIAEMCIMKDRLTALYDKRWQSARAVIDLIAKEMDIDPEKCGLHLYALKQIRGEFESPLVNEMRGWFDKSGDKAKLKKRIKDLEAQVEALRAVLRG